MRRRTKFDPRQQRLPLSRPERLAAIEAVDPAALGISRQQWSSVRRLLIEVEYTSTRGGCFARVEVLAARCGLSRGALGKVKRIAVKAGLLIVEYRYHDHGGQRSSYWQVNYQATPPLVGDAPAVAESTKPPVREDVLRTRGGCPQDTPGVSSGHPPQRVGRSASHSGASGNSECLPQVCAYPSENPLRVINPQSNFDGDEAAAERERRLTEERAVRETAKRIARRLRLISPVSVGDQRFLLQLARQDPTLERRVATAVRRVAAAMERGQVRNPLGYLRKVLANLKTEAIT